MSFSQRRLLTVAACTAASAFADYDVLKQTYSAEESLDMVLEAYSKYNANLDFDSFQKS